MGDDGGGGGDAVRLDLGSENETSGCFGLIRVRVRSCTKVLCQINSSQPVGLSQDHSPASVREGKVISSAAASGCCTTPRDRVVLRGVKVGLGDDITFRRRRQSVATRLRQVKRAEAKERRSCEGSFHLVSFPGWRIPVIEIDREMCT